MRINVLKRTVMSLLLLAAGSANAGFEDMLKSAGKVLESGSGTGSGASLSAASSLSTAQIDAGLKEALSIGAERAVAVLGSDGGFMNDAAVRIPLPGSLDTVARGLRAAGQGKYVDDFESTVNHAAEEAVPATLEIVQNTVKNMNLDDVRGILSGGDDAATRFLQDRAGPSLREAILPIVAKTTDQAGATAAYKKLKSQAEGSLGGLGALGGLIDTGSLDLDGYVTDKTLDGLFLKLANEEKMIRQNPVARSTDLLKSVFGG
jgi:hypothetical protein